MLLVGRTPGRSFTLHGEPDSPAEKTRSATGVQPSMETVTGLIPRVPNDVQPSANTFPVGLILNRALGISSGLLKSSDKLSWVDDIFQA